MPNIIISPDYVGRLLQPVDITARIAIQKCFIGVSWRKKEKSRPVKKSPFRNYLRRRKTFARRETEINKHYVFAREDGFFTGKTSALFFFFSFFFPNVAISSLPRQTIIIMT